MVEDLEAMDNHLEGLTALALKNDELKDNIAWTIAQLAKQLVFMSKIEEAEAIIKRALIISPGDENILQIQKEIDNKGAIQESFHALSDDGSVQEAVRHLIELEIFYNKMNPFEVMQRELLADYLELILVARETSCFHYGT
jgi:tetratricopeptide (TPR) repeat protein